MFRLTTDRIFDLLTPLQPFQIWAEMKTKSVKFEYNVNFLIKSSTAKKFEMHL